MKYRKKPVAIDAVRITYDNLVEVSRWCGGDYKRSVYFDGRPDTHHIVISTLEGEMTANCGDWVIKGVKGEFYPCRHDIFIETYEPSQFD